MTPEDSRKGARTACRSRQTEGQGKLSRHQKRQAKRQQLSLEEKDSISNLDLEREGRCEFYSLLSLGPGVIHLQKLLRILPGFNKLFT